MKMASSLKRVFLGLNSLAKLIDPWITPYLVNHWVHPLRRVHSPGSGFLVLEPVLELRGCVWDPLSQGGLRLLSGTPQGTMKPLKVATGFGMGEKAPTTEKHFVVILGGATQFHLGDQPTLATQFSAFDSGLDLRMRVFF